MTWLKVYCLSSVVLVAPAHVFALDLIRNGRPVSLIVMPESATPLQKQSAEKLAKYLEMASGAKLKVIYEFSGPHGTLISFGKTRMAEAAGITEQGLTYDGYRMVVKGGTLYLRGRDTDLVGGHGAQGSSRVVFGLLERLGFRWLQPTAMGVHVPKLSTVALPDDLNVVYEPPFMCVHGRFDTEGDWSMANSFRTAVKAFSAGGHTWAYGVPATLFDRHPEYFIMEKGKRVRPVNADDGQYCPTNPQVQKLIADWTIKKFDEGYDIVQLGQPDGFQPCQCPECAKLSPADQVHEANRKIVELVGRKYPDRKVHLLIYAPVNKPPTLFRRYPPNTMVEVCLTEAIQGQFGSHDKALDYWGRAVPGGMTVYVYCMGLYFDNGLAPRFTPSLAAAKMRNWHAHGVQGIYWCGGNENWGAEGPTYYTIGRMATNLALDPAEVYQEYLNLTFRKAAPAMKQYYDLLYEQLDHHRCWLDDWVLAGDDADETFAGLYSAEMLLKLQGFLAAARQQAAGDARAQRLDSPGGDLLQPLRPDCQGIPLPARLRLNPSWENLKQVRAAVDAYRTWAEETVQIPRKDKAFAENFFPSVGIWASERLKTNYGHLDCEPFQ